MDPPATAGEADADYEYVNPGDFFGQIDWYSVVMFHPSVSFPTEVQGLVTFSFKSCVSQLLWTKLGEMLYTFNLT